MSTLIQLRGGHTTHLPRSIPTEVARQIEAARQSGCHFCWFHDQGQNTAAVDPDAVVAVYETDPKELS